MNDREREAREYAHREYEVRKRCAPPGKGHGDRCCDLYRGYLVGAAAQRAKLRRILNFTGEGDK